MIQRCGTFFLHGHSQADRDQKVTGIKCVMSADVAAMLYLNWMFCGPPRRYSQTQGLSSFPSQTILVDAIFFSYTFSKSKDLHYLPTKDSSIHLLICFLLVHVFWKNYSVPWNQIFAPLYDYKVQVCAAHGLSEPALIIYFFCLSSYPRTPSATDERLDLPVFSHPMRSGVTLFTSTLHGTLIFIWNRNFFSYLHWNLEATLYFVSLIFFQSHQVIHHCL